MKTMASVLMLALVATAGALRAGTGHADEIKQRIRVEIDLVDGSMLKGEVEGPLKFCVHTSYADIHVPLDRAKTVVFEDDRETVSVAMQNGDKLNGAADLELVALGTVFGVVSVDAVHIRTIRVVSVRVMLPAGDGSLSFGEVNWTPWRTGFEIRGDKLVSLPASRAGFRYGQEGHGRGPVILTNAGAAGWRDYSVEFDFCMSGVDPSFNPYGLPQEHRGGSIWFRVADARESWNESGWSGYRLGLFGDGTWNLTCTYNSYCRVESGWGSPLYDAHRLLASGEGLKLDPVNGNRFRVDIRSNHMVIWVDGEMLAEAERFSGCPAVG